jgi:hypothetical protein
MKEHEEEPCEEPWFDWKWKRFPGHARTDAELKRERNAERETDRDLTKSIPQLLADFNNVAELSLQEGRASEETKLLINAQKRMVAMMAKVGMEHITLSRRMLGLTIGIVLLTAVLVLKEFWPLLFHAKP